MGKERDPREEGPSDFTMNLMEYMKDSSVVQPEPVGQPESQPKPSTELNPKAEASTNMPANPGPEVRPQPAQEENEMHDQSLFEPDSLLEDVNGTEEIRELQQEVDEMQDTIESQHQEILKLRATLTASESSTQTFQTQLQQAHTAKQRSDAQVSELQLKYDRVEALRRQSEENAKALKAQLAAATTSAKNLEDLLETTRRMSSERTDISTHQVDALKKEIETLKSTHATAMSTQTSAISTKINEHSEHLARQKARFETETRTLRETHARHVRELEAEKVGTEDKVSALEIENAFLQQEISTLEAKLTDQQHAASAPVPVLAQVEAIPVVQTVVPPTTPLSSQVAELEAAFAALQAKHALDLDAAKTSANGHVTHLQDMVDSLRNIIQGMSAQAEMIPNLQNTVATLQKHLQAKEETSNGYQKKMQDLEESLQRQRQEVVAAQESRNEDQAQLNVALEANKGLLQQVVLQDRRLSSFSQKIEDRNRALLYEWGHKEVGKVKWQRNEGEWERGTGYHFQFFNTNGQKKSMEVVNQERLDRQTAIKEGRRVASLTSGPGGGPPNDMLVLSTKDYLTQHYERIRLSVESDHFKIEESLPAAPVQQQPIPVPQQLAPVPIVNQTSRPQPPRVEAETTHELAEMPKLRVVPEFDTMNAAEEKDWQEFMKKTNYQSTGPIHVSKSQSKQNLRKTAARNSSLRQTKDATINLMQDPTDDQSMSIASVVEQNDRAQQDAQEQDWRDEVMRRLQRWEDAQMKERAEKEKENAKVDSPVRKVSRRAEKQDGPKEWLANVRRNVMKDLQNMP